MKALEGPLLEAARDALVHGYGSWDALNELARFSLDIRLAADVAGKDVPARKTALALIEYTEEQGWTEMLLREAVRRRKDNPKLRALAATLGLAPAPPVDAGGYEAKVREGSGLASIGLWRRRMTQCERAVCQVLHRGHAVGTGFLVAPGRILSNWHVFEQPYGSGALAPPGDFAARFDFRCAEGEQAADAGITVALAGRPPADSSHKLELDYVIADLAQPMPADRKPLPLGTRAFADGEVLAILQHPDERSLELAFGQSLGWRDAAERSVLRHDAETAPGSSGSPCFAMDWSLLAVHHYGDADHNRAIATEAILRRMGAMGRLALLEA